MSNVMEIINLNHYFEWVWSLHEVVYVIGIAMIFGDPKFINSKFLYFVVIS